MNTATRNALEKRFSLEGQRGIVTGGSGGLGLAMVLFFVSPAASYITGQDFAVDGGALAFGY